MGHTNIIGLTIEDVARWPKANYVDPPRMTWLPIYVGILYALGSVMVGSRLWLRVVPRSGRFWWDDVLMALAWLGSTGYLVCAMVITQRYKGDRPIWDVPPANFVPIAFMVFLAELCFLYTQCCIKLSILVLYQRLVDGSSGRRFMFALHSGIAVVTAYTIAYILVSCFACIPTHAAWKAFDFGYEASADYTCLSTGTTYINISNGILAGLTDLYVVFLPWTITRHLNLPKRQVNALKFVFSLGALATVASAVRTYYLYEVGAALDITGNLYKCVVCAYMELQLGIICANAPAARAFFRMYIIKPIRQGRLSSDHDAVALHHAASKPGVSVSTSFSEFDPEPDQKVMVSETGRVVVVPVQKAVSTPMEYEAHNARIIAASRQSVLRGL